MHASYRQPNEDHKVLEWPWDRAGHATDLQTAGTFEGEAECELRPADEQRLEG